MSVQPVRGVKDIIGIQAVEHLSVVEVARTAAYNYGFEEAILPIFEKSEVFHRSLGETSDVVSKETYTFIDRDKTSITLRPEFTASVVRAFISNGLTQTIPQKFFSYGPVFRHERPQKCRYRQFHQINAEYLGVNHPYADAELISLAYNIIASLGLKDAVRLELNTLGDLESRLAYKEKLIEYFTKYEEDLSQESKLRLHKNPLRILDSKDEGDKKIAGDAPKMRDFLNENSRKFFNQVLEGLKELGIPYIINDTIVRGLDYYTHTVFEFVTSELGSQGTVLAGGRYDGLVELMGGPSTPSVGFAAGVERLAELREHLGITSKNAKNFYFIAIGEEAELKSQKVILELRNQGLRVFSDYIPNVSKKFKKANSVNAVATIILGDDEIKNLSCKVKNMTTGIEEIVSIDKLVLYLKNL